MSDDKPAPILRDVLAMERTALANERTLLAYVRTAVGLMAGGVGLTQFVPGVWAGLAGWGSVAVGVFFAVVGVWRFFHTRRQIAAEVTVVPTK